MPSTTDVGRERGDLSRKVIQIGSAGLCALPFKNLLIKVNIIFKVGMVLNTMALLTASKQSSGTDIRSRTNVHYLVFHLTIADTLVSFITMPLEAAWRFTLQVRKVILTQLYFRI